MGKRRNTAKTGDKKIYKAREQQASSLSAAHRKRNDSDDDAMYSKVDRFHNEREFIHLNSDDGNNTNNKSDSDSDEEQVEAVMDLGVGGDESSSDDDDDDDDSSEASEALSDDDDDAEKALSSDSDDDDDDDDEDDLAANVRDWGKKKSAYYHGDTADLEIGQEEDDAFLEEKAAEEIQAARYEEMSEDDFVISDTENDKPEAMDATAQATTTTTTTALSSTRDLSKLSGKDRQKILDKQHPEMLPLLSYFSGMVKELDEKTRIATNVLFEGEEGSAEAVGTTKEGKRYLLTKALLQSSTALNLAMYLLLKMDHSSSDGDADDQIAVDPTLIQSHPVMSRLEKLNGLTQRLEEKVESQVPVVEQISSLVQAAALMASATDDDDDNNNDDDDDDEHDDDSPDSRKEKDPVDSQDMDIVAAAKDQVPEHTSSEDDSSVDLKAEERRVMTEARFGLRASEVEPTSKPSASQMTAKRRRKELDFGDDGEANEESQKAARSLATTLNRIEQKSAATTKKRRSAPLADGIDETNDDDNDELRRGLAMMEEEFGKNFDKEDSDDDDGSAQGGEFNAELDDGEEDDFYAQVSKKSKSRKTAKKEKYAVAPKFPRVDHEIKGERALSKTILKNRGLVAHKSKLNRNPRVKKREQYRKAIIRRKGAIREVRQDEGHKYGGEETGIKSKISRSRKFGR